MLALRYNFARASQNHSVTSLIIIFFKNQPERVSVTLSGTDCILFLFCIAQKRNRRRRFTNSFSEIQKCEL